MAPTNLDFDSSAILKEQSSANLIVEMPENYEAPYRTCEDDSLEVKTLDEAAQKKVRDLLTGRSQEIEIVSSTDKSMRKAVAGELLASLSRPDTKEREHARRLFMDHGYLDDAMQELGSTTLPNERAIAARALGLIASPRGIMSLVKALLDDAPEVRRAAEQALAQISGPVIANLGVLLEEELRFVEEELNFEAAEVVESFSNPTTVAIQETPFQNLTIQELVVEKPMSEATEVRGSAICLEEEAVQKAMEELQRRGLAVAAARHDAENDVRLRTENVERCREEAALRRFEDEEIRRQVEKEAAQRRADEQAKMEAEQVARRESEESRKHLVQEEASLRLEFAALQQAAEDLTRKRNELEVAQRAEVHAARCAEVEQALRELEKQYDKELALLCSEEDEFKQALEVVARRRAGVEEVRLETEAQIRRFEEEKAELEAAEEARQAEAERLRIEAEHQLSAAENRSRAEQEQLLLQMAQVERVTEEVAHRRAEVEASLQKADEEGRRLLEIQARTQATEQSCQQALAELLWLETEICQRTDTAQRLLEETRLRAQEQQQLIEEEARRRAEVEEQRLAELDALRQTLAVVAQERAEKERLLINEVNHLQFAEVEVRKQIEQAEHLRDEAQEHYRHAVEELERISFEAQGQAIEEEQMLGKIEYVRRQLVFATLATAQLAELPKEEAEKLRSLQWEQEEPAEERKSVAVRSSR